MLVERLAGGLLDRIDRGLERGRIDAVLPDGRRRTLGDRAPGPATTVTVHRWRALAHLATGGSAGWYLAWERRQWEASDLVALFELFMLNRHALGQAGRAGGPGRWVKRLGHWLRRNSRVGARRNISAHYDLGNDFYAAWLDTTLTYSSAMFDGDETLEAAQTCKLAAMLDRTATAPGARILEIGSGWGSFAELATRAGRHVHGITLSSEQCRASAARVPAADFTLTDYRDVTGVYDAVVSIEMVEAVGQQYWDGYFAAIAKALRPGGHAALQFISIDDAIFPSYAENVDFIQAYIFPGGMLVSEAEFRTLAARHGLVWTDRHGFALDYAETLRRWRERFDAAVAQRRLPAQFDARFVRLWRYYLMYCEGGFRGGGIDVAQATLVKEG